MYHEYMQQFYNMELYVLFKLITKYMTLYYYVLYRYKS